MAKLTESDALDIIAMLDCGWPQQMIADRYRVRQTSISNIKHSVTWAHLPRPWKG
jgi:hypothetical protein